LIWALEETQKIKPGMVSMPVIPVLRRLREEDHAFWDRLDFILRPYIKNPKQAKPAEGPTHIWFIHID
jgi:hypothetical protein